MGMSGYGIIHTTKGVLTEPRLAGHQEPNPPTCSFLGYPNEENKGQPETKASLQP